MLTRNKRKAVDSDSHAKEKVIESPTVDIDADDQENELFALITSQAPLTFLDSDSDEGRSDDAAEDSDVVEEATGSEEDEVGTDAHEDGPAPAWADDDDDDERGALDRRVQTTLIPTPDFLKVDDSKRMRHDSDSSSDDEDTVPHASKFNILDLRRSGALPHKSGRLDYKQFGNINRDRIAKARISAVQFHTRIPLAMVAGEDTSLSFFELRGNRSKVVHCDKFPNYSIKCAKFTPDGNNVIFSSRDSTFRSYDLVKGRVLQNTKITGLPPREQLRKFDISPDGKIIAFAGNSGRLYFMDAKSREKVCSTEISGNIQSLTFSHDGDFLYVYGDEGCVIVMDPRQLKSPYLRRWNDEGSINGTAIASSPDDQWLACGSFSGVVNLYPWAATCKSENPRPSKTVLNLTTCNDILKFNPTSELLFMGSSYGPRSIKLMHMATRTVFSNFPESHMSNPCAITCMDFSPSSSYLCLGNVRGQAELYRLFHYKGY